VFLLAILAGLAAIFMGLPAILVLLAAIFTSLPAILRLPSNTDMPLK